MGDPRPLGLLAELTHRCPLGCPYCSNPVSPGRTGSELSTGEWIRVIEEAASLGVLHALFSGGEPLLRKDLVTLVSAAREKNLYTNLITSAVGLASQRIRELKAAGLESIQISFQSDQAQAADRIAGRNVHEKKLEAARQVRDAGLPLTINMVLHRSNIVRIREFVDFAMGLGADRLELAHAQYYGWAWKNRRALLPTRGQVERAGKIVEEARRRLRGRMEILYVLPDYFGDRPKPCMNGWGQRYLTVDPGGDVLPCPTAREIPSLQFENVRNRPLREIWGGSEAFNRFRGTAWMPEPCRSCPEKTVDFGGCRCQAALLLGDASRTDPACARSPDRRRLAELLDVESESDSFVYRVDPR
jgi:pyrroloquinoline quinone biosynthesis protein E